MKFMELQLNNKEKYIFIETFGCQMNENDSERILGMLRHLNYKTADTPDKADVIILNTCSIRDKAEQKVYSALGRLKKIKADKPDLIIGVGGCVAQQEGERLLKRVSYLDIVFGTHNAHRLPDLIQEAKISGNRIASTEFSDSMEEESFAYAYEENGIEKPPHRVKASVTIMRGCDNFCAYCIVPYVRGREVSRESADIMREIKHLAEEGVKEITLLGQNVNSYGNKSRDVSFHELLKLVCKVDGIERVRFITSHPKDMSGQLIKIFGEEEKLCRHIHLPVQSGSDAVLKRMNRGYTREEYLNKLHTLKKLYPDMGITTDIIVGFPGETDIDFSDTMSLIREAEFDNIFSFKYSQRKETKAASFDGQVADEIKEKRLAVLQEAQREITLCKNRQLAGKVTDVLVEGKAVRSSEFGVRSQEPGGMGLCFYPGLPITDSQLQLMGRTSCNRVVNFSGYEGLIGKIAPLLITKPSPNSLNGILMEKKEMLQLYRYRMRKG